MMYSKVHIVAVCLLLVQTVLQSAHGVRLNDVSSQKKLDDVSPQQPKEPKAKEPKAKEPKAKEPIPQTFGDMRKYLEEALKKIDARKTYLKKDEKCVAELEEIKKSRTELWARFDKAEKGANGAAITEAEFKKLQTEFDELVAKPTHKALSDFAERSEKELRAVLLKELESFRAKISEGLVTDEQLSKCMTMSTAELNQKLLDRLKTAEKEIMAAPIRDVLEIATRELDGFAAYTTETMDQAAKAPPPGLIQRVVNWINGLYSPF